MPYEREGDTEVGNGEGRTLRRTDMKMSLNMRC
jgi:hypothetical protein